MKYNIYYSSPYWYLYDENEKLIMKSYLETEIKEEKERLEKKQ